MKHRLSTVALGLAFGLIGVHAIGQQRAPAPVAAGPHLVAPMPATRVSSHRPALRWSGGAGDAEVCRDRACSQVIATAHGTSGSAQPTADLPAGRVFWRVRSGAAVSPTWAFTVGARSAAVDSSSSSMFDANGDGFADAFVRGSDAVAIYLGGAHGMGAQPAITVRAPREAIGFGFMAAVAGDVNGDGMSDLLVGTFGADRVYVYLGTATGIAPTPSVTLRGAANSMFGFAVAGAGDVNGDGYADVVVGAPTAGRVQLFRGGPNGTQAEAISTLTAPPHANHFGYSVAGIGDVNADGHADIAVGTLSDEAFVYQGQADGVPAAATSHIVNAAADFGSTIAGAGDVNGDGYGDFIVGAAGSNAFYVYSGGAHGADIEHPTSAIGTARSFEGLAVAGADDLNNDGFSDVIVALGNASAVVYAGSATGLVTATPMHTLSLPQGGEYSLGVTGAGDVNGDGFADAMLWSRANSTTQVFLGSSTGVAENAAATLHGPVAVLQAAAAPVQADTDDR